MPRVVVSDPRRPPLRSVPPPTPEAASRCRSRSSWLIKTDDYGMNTSFGRTRTGEHAGRSTVRTHAMDPAAKKRPTMSAAWREARELVWIHRRRLTIGLSLMLVSRLASMVAPLAPQFLIDDVVTKQRFDLLTPIALAVVAATAVQAVTSFALSQILGVAAQRAITDMRKRVQAHVMRLPVRYYDSTQT